MEFEGEFKTDFGGTRPSFENPPVIEVALSVQFEPLASFTSAHGGLFRESIRSEFPEVQNRELLNHVVEQFGPPQPSLPSFELVQEGPTPRFWFLNQDKDELLQVQSDRFVFNWKKKDGEPYPRYGHVKERFTQCFLGFGAFVANQGLGEITVDQCEVTYVNHIQGPSGARPAAEQILAGWNDKRSDGFLGPCESATILTSYLMQARGGGIVGRLHARAEPRFELSSGAPILRLTLTARGAPLAEGLTGIHQFFDLGREHVVRGFASLTTKKMHKAWRRYDDVPV